ncbi:hypothetical protein [Limimaricola cinnabarinus]|uniref:hypothetical protein n=1 Tax=Limimaricola cinnabarinus TaxID=1125964 RepID=UPI00103C137F|nr:hypothetical protein [Limimaricola cinnabarinus]
MFDRAVASLKHQARRQVDEAQHLAKLGPYGGGHSTKQQIRFEGFGGHETSSRLGREKSEAPGDHARTIRRPIMEAYRGHPPFSKALWNKAYEMAHSFAIIGPISHGPARRMHINQ